LSEVKDAKVSATAGWTEKKVEPTGTDTKTTTDTTATTDSDSSAPVAGACGAEGECDTKVGDVDVECGAAKLGAGILATLAIAASL
jgi:carbohydrate-binding DOMON domain-containing protein